MSETSYLEAIEAYFNIVAAIVLTTIGLIGNSLVLYIITRPQFLKVALFRYLIVATIFDTINFLFIWPSDLPEAFYMNKYAIICKLYQYLSYMAYQFSIWIIVLSSVDRYLAVKFPTKFKIRNKFKYQAIAMVTIFVILLLIDIPYLMYYDIYGDSNETYCGYNPESISLGFYMDLLNSFISSIVPFIIIMLTTALIAHHLITKKLKLQQNRKNFEKELQFVKIIGAMDLFYLACTIPFCVLTVTYDALGINYFGRLEFNIVNFLTYVYSSCEFFIYFSCNKLFRTYFLSMIGCCRKSKPVSST